MTKQDSPLSPAILLERLKKAAAAANMQILDERWYGWARYHLRCPAGHVWSYSAQRIASGAPLVCPECWGIRQLVRLTAATEPNGSTCLDTHWHGANSKYRFRCTAGHLWERSAINVLYNGATVCPQCTRQASGSETKTEQSADGLERLRATAAAHGGQLLDDRYLGAAARYRFRCAQGHEWETQGSNIWSGHWCPHCGQGAYRTGIAALQAIAAQRGGQCLSQAYQNEDTELTWMCGKEHVWQATGKRIKNGHWCPQCARGESPPLGLNETHTANSDSQRYRTARRGTQLRADGLERLRAAAAAHGGQLLDEYYFGVAARYQFRCARGHEWETAGNAVLRGSWCWRCHVEDRGLASRNPEGLARLQAAAAAKGGICLSQTYTGQKTRYQFRCAQGHEWETPGNAVFSGKWCRRCSHEEMSRARRDPEGLARLQAAAAARGGVCLSETFTNQDARYRFRCAQGHEWETLGMVILRGAWCSRCAYDAQRDNIEIFQEIAVQRGGQCLSQVYHDCETKLTWMCHKGHVWNATPEGVKRGHWCPECAHANKITRANSKARMRYGVSPL